MDLQLKPLQHLTDEILTRKSQSSVKEIPEHHHFIRFRQGDFPAARSLTPIAHCRVQQAIRHVFVKIRLCHF